MDKMTIELTEAETNSILQALAKQPYENVYQLIQKIQLTWKQQHQGETER